MSASVKLVYPVSPWYIPELEDRDREQDEGPITKKELVSDLLHHCNTHEFVGPEQIHPRVRELVEELINPVSSIYQQFWIIKEIPGDWRLVSVTTQLQEKPGGSGELQSYQPDLDARECYGADHLGCSYPSHIGQSDIRLTWDGLMKGPA